MHTLLNILILVVQIYTWILIGRILVEMIVSFSRNFQAPQFMVIIFEVLFKLTDPPVRLLRRWIPPLKLGNVALDVSILGLFFALSFIRILLSIALYSV